MLQKSLVNRCKKHQPELLQKKGKTPGTVAENIGKLLQKTPPSQKTPVQAGKTPVSENTPLTVGKTPVPYPVHPRITESEVL